MSKMQASMSITRAPLETYETGNRFDNWHVDFIGTLPTSENGNRFIILFVDRATRWVEAMALPEQTANAAATALISLVVSRFGLPSTLHSDQGTQFEASVFETLCKKLKIVKTRTTAYRPQSNGIAERNVQSLKTKLKILVDGRPFEWDLYLEQALLGMRMTVNETTIISPYELVYGKKPRLATDLPKSDEINLAVSRMDNIAEIETLVKIAKENIERNVENRNRRYGAQGHMNNFEVGDSVLIKKPFKSALEEHYEGPGTVSSVINEQLLEVSNNGTKKVIHHDRLKPYNSWHEPNEKRRIIIPDRNKEFVEKNLPSFLGRGRNVEKSDYHEGADNPPSQKSPESHGRINPARI